METTELLTACVILQGFNTPIVRNLIGLPRYVDEKTVNEMIKQKEDELFGYNVKEIVTNAVFNKLYETLDNIFAPPEVNTKYAVLIRANKIVNMAKAIMAGKYANLTLIQLEDLINGTHMHVTPHNK